MICSPSERNKSESHHKTSQIVEKKGNEWDVLEGVGDEHKVKKDSYCLHKFETTECMKYQMTCGRASVIVARTICVLAYKN